VARAGVVTDPPNNVSIVEDDCEVVAKPGLDLDSERVGGEYGVVESGFEPVGDEYGVVAKPRGDELLEYVEGLGDAPPRGGSADWLALASELFRYLRMKAEAERRGMVAKAGEYGRRARRLAKLVYSSCPRLRAGLCPLRDPLSKCPLRLERRCRALDRRRPRRVRAWVRGRR